MTTISIALWALLLPLTVLIAAVLWISESKQQRACRWRRAGRSQQQIADRLGCSRYAVRKLLAA